MVTTSNPPPSGGLHVVFRSRFRIVRLRVATLYTCDHSDSQQLAQGLPLPVCKFYQQSSWGLRAIQSGSRQSFEDGR